MRSAERLRYAILAAQREGNRILAEGLRPLGVTPSQAEALRVLEDHGPLLLKDLGALLICESGSPSRLLATLTAKDLVGRASIPEDGRAVALQLTPKGAEVAAAVRALEEVLYASIDQSVPAEAAGVALTVLEALIEDRTAGRALQRRRGLAGS